MRTVVRPRVPWATLSLGIICFVFAMIPQSGPFAYDRQAILRGELWRLWTGHMVHFSQPQLLLDGGVLLLAGTLAERELGARFVAKAMLLGIPALSTGLLLLTPNLSEYRGISALDMLLAGAAASSIGRGTPGARSALLFLGMVMAVKSAMDATGMGSISLPENVCVVWQAHVLGAILGWLAACRSWKHSL